MTQARPLGGRYELGETLGYGGMAEVHLGRDVRLGREVAVKVLRADLARDPSFQARFRREAQAAASLNHPAIVAVYDTGEDANPANPNGALPYIVMEYVEGRTLRDILKNEGPLHPQRGMEIVADICAALDYSHRNGIVHRDVKPGNVMVTRNGAVKVMDFGIARAVTDSAATVTSTAAVIGTAQYLSPEQARGESVDARSDVYSTGCLLYELLSGHPPFTGDSPVAVAYQHVREDPIPPSQVNRDVPRALDAIVLKAMAKNPINRYQSAAEMRADLARAISGRPVQAEPVMSDEERTTVLGGPIRTGPVRPPPPPMEPEEPRNRRALAFVLLGLGVIAIFVIAALIISNALAGGGGGAEKVSVPPLVGKTEAEARTALEDANLKLGTTSRQESTAEQKDKVIAQAPTQGARLDEGDTVDITLGSGPNAVTIPQIVGQNVDTVETQLRQMGLNSVRQDADSEEPEGTVVGSEPAPGAQVAEGTTVTLKVSTGKIEMPNLVGRTADQALTTLDEKGFTNIQPEYQETNDVPEGTVISQDPTAGTSVGKDDRIVITIAQKEPEPSPTPTPTPSQTTPTPTPSGLPTLPTPP